MGNVIDFNDEIIGWEEEDELIMNEIRRQSDDVKIPEGLLPENMMKKIKQESMKTGENRQKRHWKKSWNAKFVKRTVSLVTAAVLCIIAIYQLPNIKGTVTLSNWDSKNKEVIYGKIENMVKASDRDEIYSKLKVKSQTETGYGGIKGEDFVSNDMAEEEVEKNNNSSVNDDATEAEDYYKDTNEQVEGVSEGDQVKTDGKYIYIASNNKDVINIMSANKGNMGNVSKIEYKSIIENDIKKDLGFSQGEISDVIIGSKEMYVNGDVLTLVLNVCARNKDEYRKDSYSEIEYGCYDDFYYFSGYNITYILSYDISDRNEPELLAKHSQEGYFNTSRVADGYLYVLSVMTYSSSEKINDDRIMPYVDGTEAQTDSVYVNEDGGKTYTIITALEIAHPEEFSSNINVLTGAGVVYINQENIYITESSYNNSYTELENNGKKGIDSQDTIINKFRYESGKLYSEASAKVKGRIDSQFYLDEYDGTLRVVASSWENIMEYIPVDYATIEGEIGIDGIDSEYFDDIENDSNRINYSLLVDLFSSMYGENVSGLEKIGDDWYVYISDTNRENLVYVMDEQLNIIGQINGIAKNEDLYSARFMGDTGYFVTYETVDPLFAVDFSDKTNPKIISELKVPGFSTYLHFWEEGKLLGIGCETENNRTTGCKFSMFDISNPSNVTEENKLVVDNATSNALYDYKSILISKEKNIIGVAMQVYDSAENLDVVSKEIGRYVIYSYDDEQGFVQTFRYEYDIATKEGEYRVLRGIIINDVFYLVTVDENIQSYDITQNFKPISTLTY